MRNITLQNVLLTVTILLLSLVMFQQAKIAQKQTDCIVAMVSDMLAGNHEAQKLHCNAEMMLPESK